MEYKYWFEHKFSISEMILIAAALRESESPGADELAELFENCAVYWMEGC